MLYLIEQPKKLLHFQKLLSQTLSQGSVPRLVLSQPDAGLLQEFVSLNKTLP